MYCTVKAFDTSYTISFRVRCWDVIFDGTPERRNESRRVEVSYTSFFVLFALVGLIKKKKEQIHPPSCDDSYKNNTNGAVKVL